MISQKLQDILLTESVDIATSSDVTLRSLPGVAQPPCVNPFLDLVVVFSQTCCEVSHRIPLADAPRCPEGLNLHDHRGFSAPQLLGNSLCCHSTEHTSALFLILPSP